MPALQPGRHSSPAGARALSRREAPTISPVGRAPRPGPCEELLRPGEIRLASSISNRSSVIPRHSGTALRPPCPPATDIVSPARHVRKKRLFERISSDLDRRPQTHQRLRYPSRVASNPNESINPEQRPGSAHLRPSAPNRLA